MTVDELWVRSCARRWTYYAERPLRSEAAVEAANFEAVLLRDEILVVQQDQRSEEEGDELTTRKIAAERSKRTQKWRTENYVGTHGQQNSREGKRRGKRGKRRGSGELPGRKFRAQISCDRQTSRQLAGVLQATFETFSRAKYFWGVPSCSNPRILVKAVKVASSDE